MYVAAQPKTNIKRPRVDRKRFALYIELRNRGFSQTEIARMGGPSARWQAGYEAEPGQSAYRTLSDARREMCAVWLKDLEAAGGHHFNPKVLEKEPGLLGALPAHRLRPEAEAALEDFELFRARYLGHVSLPWHVEAARVIREALKSSGRQFICMNVFPGSGKSTLNRDIALWVTVQNRAIRGLWGGASLRLAGRETQQLRSMLERTSPVKSDVDMIAKGRAVDAVSSLAEEFGMFKPAHVGGDIWTREMFTVIQADGTPTSEKEATWTAFGRDSHVLGWRVDLEIWDDLVTNRNHRTLEGRDDLEDWFIQEGESRLEPDGVLDLCGQRIHGDDLYWRRLQDRISDEFDAEPVTIGDDPGDDIGPNTRSKYTHIVFPAHDDSKCLGDHLRGDPNDPHHPDNAKAWPDGCLLDPVRMPWYGAGGLLQLRTNRPRMYDLTYQQKDVSEVDVLVPKVYITGGVDPEDGSELPGCWDNDRDLCRLPKNLAGPFISVATVDPSPTKFWAVQWWVIQPSTQQCFLMDLEKRQMDAPDFLDYYPETGEHAGMMEDWQRRSVQMGLPIRHWVVEKNAAQRFMLQYNHVQTWIRQNGARIIGHQTGMNKGDETYGIQMVREWFRFGRIRLPGAADGVSRARITSLKLVDEVTRYPHGGTDDQMMACWFMLHNLPKLMPSKAASNPAPRPSWLSELAGR